MGVTRTYRLTGDNDEFYRVKAILIDMQLKVVEPWQLTVSIMHHKNPNSGVEMCIIRSKTEEIVVLNKQTESNILNGEKLSVFIDNLDTFKLRQSYSLEGLLWRIGDISVRLGQAQLSGDTKLSLLEVEFAAAFYLSHGEKVLEEFVGFLDSNRSFSSRRADYAKFRLNAEEWTSRHSALDLLVAMNCLGAR